MVNGVTLGLSSPTRRPLGRFRATDSLIDRLIQAESGGDPLAVSSAGARGLGQVLPSTAADPGFGVRPLEDPDDPEEQRRFARDYFDALLNEFGGDPTLAIAAYNMGPGALRGINSDQNSFPAETQGLISRVGPTEADVQIAGEDVMPHTSLNLGQGAGQPAAPTLGLAQQTARQTAFPASRSVEAELPDIAGLLQGLEPEKPNALQTIGRMLQNVAAGLEGRPLPSRDRAASQDSRALRRLQVMSASLGLEDKARERLQKQVDKHNAALVDEKFREIGAVVDGLAGSNEDVKNVFVEALGEKGALPFDDFLTINEAQAGNAFHFDENEIDFLRRNPDRLPSYVLSPEQSRERAQRETEPPTPLQKRQDVRAEAAGKRDERRLELDEARAKAEEQDVDFDSSAFRSALGVVSAGGEADPTLFGEKPAAFANSLGQEGAGRTLSNLSAQTSEVTTLDRERQKREASEEAPAPAVLTNTFPDLEPNESLESARSKGFTIPADEKTLRSLSERQNFAVTAIRTGRQIINLTRGREDVTTVAGSLSGLANALRAEVVGLAKLVDRDESEVPSLDIADYKETFQERAITGARLQGAVLSLAYSIAGAREGGRLSVSDVENAIREIGGDRSDPDTIAFTVNDAMRRLENQYADLFFFASGKRPPSLDGFVDQQILGKAAREMTRGDIESLSEQKFLELSPESRNVLKAIMRGETPS